MTSFSPPTRWSISAILRPRSAGHSAGSSPEGFCFSPWKRRKNKVTSLDPNADFATAKTMCDSWRRYLISMSWGCYSVRPAWMPKSRSKAWLRHCNARVHEGAWRRSRVCAFIRPHRAWDQEESLTMKRGLWLFAVVVPAFVAPAFMQALAQSACMEPAIPAMPNGKTAQRAEIIAAAGAAKEFITKSDEYQGCLNAEYEAAVNTGQADAKEKKQNFDAKKLNSDREAKITANQKKKEDVGKAYGAAAAAFKQANPAGK